MSSAKLIRVFHGSSISLFANTWYRAPPLMYWQRKRMKKLLFWVRTFFFYYYYVGDGWLPFTAMCMPLFSFWRNSFKTGQHWFNSFYLQIIISLFNLLFVFCNFCFNFTRRELFDNSNLVVTNAAVTLIATSFIAVTTTTTAAMTETNTTTVFMHKEKMYAIRK